MITKEQALTLLHKYIKNDKLIKHSLAVSAQMKALAKKLKENEEIWELAGLLHDLDWEITKETPEKHSLISVEILEKEDVPQQILQAIKVHNPIHGLQPTTLLEKALQSCEELTGLIVAVALVHPNKKLEEVSVKSVLEKFKEKSFASGVNRELIKKAPEYLNMPLEEIIEITLKAMKEIASELGL